MADDAAPNAGARWEPEEDERLYDAVVRDTPQNCDPPPAVAAFAAAGHGRTLGGIQARVDALRDPEHAAFQRLAARRGPLADAPPQPNLRPGAVLYVRWWGEESPGPEQYGYWRCKLSRRNGRLFITSEHPEFGDAMPFDPKEDSWVTAAAYRTPAPRAPRVVTPPPRETMAPVAVAPPLVPVAEHARTRAGSGPESHPELRASDNAQLHVSVVLYPRRGLRVRDVVSGRGQAR